MIPMFTKLIKWSSVTALVVGLFGGSSAAIRISVGLVVFIAALVVAAPTFRTSKHVWGIAFVALALLFNPIAPLTLSHQLFLGLDCVSIGIFLASLVARRWQPNPFDALNYRPDAGMRVALRFPRSEYAK